MLGHTDVSDDKGNPADDGPIASDAQVDASSSTEAVKTGEPPAPPADATTDQSAETAAADVEHDASVKAKYQEFWAIIRSCGAPNVRSEKWAFLGDDDLLRIDMPPMEFVAALRQDFTVEALTWLGLIVNDELQPASWLDGAAHLYAAIDDDKHTIVFSRGNEFLFPMTRTAIDYALERVPPDSAEVPVNLFVVESQDDVEVMQRLGLRTVSGVGLESLGRDDVATLFGGDQRSDFHWRYYLLLVDFDVARLKNRPTATFGEVIRRLADAADVYDIDPARRFGLCRPTADEFNWLKRAITFKDAAKIRQVFEKWSAAAHTISVSNWRTHFNSEIPSFTAASAALTHALRQSDDVARRAEVTDALPAYRAVGKETIMQKFYEAFDRAIDPFDQFDLMAAAGYAETFLDSDPLVLAGEAVLAGQTPPSARELQDEVFAQRQRCMVEVRRIRRDRKGNR
jgi:hypothetical protein